MANLALEFSDLYNEVLRFTGEYNNGSPASTPLADAKRIVNRAYQRFVNFYDWTFLRVAGKLETASGVHVYELPADFSYITPDEFVFDDSEPYHKTQPVTAQLLQHLRSGVVYSSFPEYHTIYAGPYTKETGQGWLAAFYPTPDDAYTLHYWYRLNPQKLENDTDLPIGGPEMGDMLLELCLAYAETYKDETKAVHDATVREILAPAISLDIRRRPKHLGSLGTPRSRPVYGEVIEGWSLTNLT